MTETEANAVVGRKVRNRRTGNEFICYDCRIGCLYLSGGQIIPWDAFEMFWEIVP